MLILTADDLELLTGKVRPSAQAAVLREMQIPFACRPDGSLAVLREAVLARLGGERTIARKPPQLRLPA